MIISSNSLSQGSGMLHQVGDVYCTPCLVPGCPYEPSRVTTELDTITGVSDPERPVAPG